VVFTLPLTAVLFSRCFTFVDCVASPAAPTDGITLNQEEVERLRQLLKTARAQIHGLKFQLQHGQDTFDRVSFMQSEERESTVTFLSLVLKRLGVSEDRHATYQARWKDAMGA